MDSQLRAEQGSGAEASLLAGKLVVDVQGIKKEAGAAGLQHSSYVLTDPAVHTAGAAAGTPFGATDNGQAGIAAFFSGHKCNDVCRRLELPAGMHSPCPASGSPAESS